jgi:hypothetical protein
MMDLSFELSPREVAKSRLRHTLYDMSDEQFATVKRDVGKMVQDAFKKIEQETGQTVFELTAIELAERVKGGWSIDEIRDFVDRIPNEWGRGELIRTLKVHLPDEDWNAEQTIYKKDPVSAFQLRIWEEEEKAEKHLQELKDKIDAGTATYKERLQALVLQADLDAVPGCWHDPAGRHLRQQEIEGVMWVLNLLLRPIMPRGKAMVPMKPHEAAVVRSGNWVHHDKDEVSRPGGLGALIDIASF